MNREVHIQNFLQNSKLQLLVFHLVQYMHVVELFHLSFRGFFPSFLQQFAVGLYVLWWCNFFCGKFHNCSYGGR